MKSRVCFAISASFFLLSCEAKVEGKPEARPTAAAVEKSVDPELAKVVEMVEYAHEEESQPVVVQVSRVQTQAAPAPMLAMAAGPSDLEGASTVVAQQQVQEQVQQVQDHRAHLEKVSKRSDDIRMDVAEIRWRLILKRFDQLEAQAKKFKWSETKGPKKDEPLWDDYQEWLYLTKYLKEMFQNGPPNVLQAPNKAAGELKKGEKPTKVEKPVAVPPPPSKKPKGAKKGGYRPRWMK